MSQASCKRKGGAPGGESAREATWEPRGQAIAKTRSRKNLGRLLVVAAMATGPPPVMPFAHPLEARVPACSCGIPNRPRETLRAGGLLSYSCCSQQGQDR